MDHFFDFTYTHLMIGEPTAANTVKAKLAFKRITASHRVRIKHYHSDNGLFDMKLFKASIVSAKQMLSHHQNGKAENRIKDVITGACTSLYMQHTAVPKLSTLLCDQWP
jgi:DNA-directed RNA polymerase specialized sigma54-like protein